MLQNDGKFVKVLNRIADLVGLNLLAILFCIPIVTIGASITAVYGCIFRIQEKKEGYLIKDFWKLFKASFRSSTIIYLVGVLVIAMLYLDYHIFAADRTMNALQILVIAAGIIVAEIFNLEYSIYIAYAGFEYPSIFYYFKNSNCIWYLVFDRYLGNCMDQQFFLKEDFSKCKNTKGCVIDDETAVHM